jgi:3-hydroxybutyryl-CoA dehydratase
MKARATVGETFEREVHFDRQSIADFARLAGDANPVHHDEEYAASTRFGGLIASGAHTTSLLMSLTATHFSQGGAMLGLDFKFRFTRPVREGDVITLWWQVVALRPAAAFGGEIVLLAGRARRSDGTVAVKAAGKVLLCAAL